MLVEALLVLVDKLDNPHNLDYLNGRSNGGTNGRDSPEILDRKADQCQ